ncbi:MAG: TIGR04063 family PEP-CTERM/XrtA system glycosyltransferase [Gammaproteobacteria bacterium]
MKVLHILDHSLPVHSGYTFRTRAILEHQRAKGWTTYHVTSAKHPMEGDAEEEIDGLRFFRSTKPRGLAARLPVVNQWAVVRTLEARLDELIGRLRPDVLHAHSPALNGLAALRAGRRHGIPVVYEVRAFWEDAAVDHGTSQEWGARYRLTRALESYVLRNAAAVTTICEGLRQDIVGRGVPADRVTVIPNAVDLEQFSADGTADPLLKQELGLENSRVLGFIGSFYSYEGLADLLRAMSRIRQHESAVKLLLVGGGPQEAELRRLTAELQLHESVVFTGRVAHSDVQRYYDLIDLFVYPRQSMRLTELVTPLKPLEAMARGRLVIASDVGGHRELISDRETGRLFKAGDPESLAATVVDFLENPGQWDASRETARRFVETQRNWPGSVARYEAVYGPLVAERRT